MNKFTSYFKKIGFFTICATVLSTSANAAVYTAALSGNFNAAATWGGTAPAAMISSDDIIIPTGITVILTTDQTFTGTSSLTVQGTLTSSSSGLIMTAGTLAGSGTISVDSLALSLSSGITYLGSIAVQKFTSLGASIATAAGITVGGTLRLMSGTLAFTAGSLTMANGSTVEVSNGGITVGGTGILNLANTYNVSYISSSANAGAELSGSGLRDVTVNVPGTVTLSTNLNENGTLTLINGTLSLNNHNLSFGTNGDLSASGIGNINSTSGSNIAVNATNGLSGNLHFAAGGSTVNNLTLNMGNATSVAGIGSNLTVNGQLHLMMGKVNVWSNSLMIAAGGTLNGGTANSYVVTNGIGSLVMHLVASTTDTFQVGTMTNYSPMAIIGNSGSASGDVSVSVVNAVYASGTTGVVLSNTQKLVNATWFVSSTATTGINYDLHAMWSAGMEVNGFDRTQAYISHFTSGAWDQTAFASATTASNGMYLMTRTGITSLSPFTVADKNATLATLEYKYENSASVTLFPNPTNNELFFNTTAKMDKANIFDISGHLVKSANIDSKNSVSVQELAPGVYTISLTGVGVRSVQKFVKK